MNRRYKIFTIIIILMILIMKIILFSGNSYAEECSINELDASGVGGIYYVHINHLISYDNIYCIEEGKHLESNYFYRLQDTIQINGNEITINGERKPDKDGIHNNILGAILCENEIEGYDKNKVLGYGSDTSEHNPSQIGVWTYWPTWQSIVGISAGSKGETDNQELLAKYIEKANSKKYKCTIYTIIHSTDQNVILVEREKIEESEPYECKLEISGKIWLDGQAGKGNKINGIYNTGEKTPESVIVRLKNQDGTYFKLGETTYETTPNNNGEYIISVNFVESSDEYHNIEEIQQKLEEMYIEFEYNGQKYTTVANSTTGNNKSKAIENKNVRVSIDNNYSNINSSTSNNFADAKITAKTNALSTFAQVEGDDIKIKNLNLGLFEREQPDIAIFSNLNKVEVTQNGKKYTYLYGINGGENMNVGLQVKFQNKNGTYKRPVNPVDIVNLNENIGETNIVITYKVKVANLSTTLPIIVHNLINCYDSRYTLNTTGWNTVNKEGFKEATSGDLNIIVEPQKESEEIELTYTVSGDALNGKIALNNAIEIGSYSTKYGTNTIYAEQKTGERTGNSYAGYDENSHPGNSGIFVNAEGKLQANNLEDDTDIASSFVLY